MNEALKTIALEMPRFILNLVKLLVNPAGFISEMDFDSQKRLINITKALTFSVIAYVLAETASYLNLSKYFPPDLNVTMYYSVRLVFAILAFVGYFVALYFSNKVVGSKASAEDLLIIHSYYFGTFVIIHLVFSSMLEGFMVSSERHFGQSDALLPANVYLWWAPEMLCLLVWGLFAWQAYRNKGDLTIPRSIAALLLSTVLAVIVWLISETMSSGFLPEIKP